MQPSTTDDLTIEAGAAPARRSKWAAIRFLDRFNEGLLLTLSLVLGGLACLGIAQVIARYVFSSPVAWSEEVIRFALIWIVFLGAGVAVRRGMLVAVEAIYIVASASVARIVNALSLIVSAVFWAVLVTYGWSIMDMVQGMTSGSLELPMTLVYAAIPAGALLAVINTLAVAVDPPHQVFTQAAS